MYQGSGLENNEMGYSRHFEQKERQTARSLMAPPHEFLTHANEVRFHSVPMPPHVLGLKNRIEDKQEYLETNRIPPPSLVESNKLDKNNQTKTSSFIPHQNMPHRGATPQNQ